MRVEEHIRELARLRGANPTDADVKLIKKALDGKYLDSLLDGRKPFSDERADTDKAE